MPWSTEVDIGAGHTKMSPSMMGKCPCADGLSRDDAEDTSKEWAAASADIPFHAVADTTEIVE